MPRWQVCSQSTGYCILLLLLGGTTAAPASVKKSQILMPLPDHDTSTDSLVAAAQKAIDKLINSDPRYLDHETPTMVAIINNSTFNLGYTDNARSHNGKLYSIPDNVPSYHAGIVQGHANSEFDKNFGVDFSFALHYDLNQVDHKSYAWENSGYLTIAVENTPGDKIPNARDATKVNVCSQGMMEQWCHGSNLGDQCWDDRSYKISKSYVVKPEDCFWPGEFRVHWHHGTYITTDENSKSETKIPVYFVVLSNEKTKYGFQRRRVADLSWRKEDYPKTPFIKSFVLQSTRDVEDDFVKDWSGEFRYDHHIYPQKWGCENAIFNCYNDIGASEIEYPMYVSDKAVIFYMGNAFSFRPGSYQEGHMIESWAMTDIRHYDRIVQYSLMQICMVRAGWCGAFGGQPIMYSYTGLDGFYGNTRAEKDEDLFMYEYTTCSSCGWSDSGVGPMYGHPQYKMTKLTLGTD